MEDPSELADMFSDDDEESSSESRSSDSCDECSEDSDSHYNHGNYLSFKRTLRCVSVSSVKMPHLEFGNRVVLPESTLSALTASDIDFPMTFQIQKISLENTEDSSDAEDEDEEYSSDGGDEEDSGNGGDEEDEEVDEEEDDEEEEESDEESWVSHCGVLEFTAEEGSMYVPAWIMKNLRLQEGELMSIRSIRSLPKGSFVKLRPHSTGFFLLSNPRDVLEMCLMNFCCLTVGETILINYNNRDYLLDVLDAKPANAISVIDTDCEVEFESPPTPPPIVSEAPGYRKEGARLKFKPFTGEARRLDGKPVAAKEKGKVVFVADSDFSWRSLCQSRKVSSGKEESHLENGSPKFQAFTGKKYTLIDAHNEPTPNVGSCHG